MTCKARAAMAVRHLVFLLPSSFDPILCDIQSCRTEALERMTRLRLTLLLSMAAASKEMIFHVQPSELSNCASDIFVIEHPL
jgi:hypothetical protein